MDVHHPYRPPKDYRLRFVRKVARYLYRNGIPPKDRHPDEDDLRFMQDLYDGEIRYVDDRLREIRGWLADRGILGNTVTIFASDHGEEFLEHGGLGHGRDARSRDGRVPLVIHGVHGFAPTRVATVVENIDIARTIAEIGEATIPEAFEGQSLLEVSASKLDANAAAFSWEYFRKLRSVTTRSWHAYWNRDEDTFSLYDLTADPDGLEDVATAHTEVAAPFAAVVEAVTMSWRRAAKSPSASRRSVTGRPARSQPTSSSSSNRLGISEVRSERPVINLRTVAFFLVGLLSLVACTREAPSRVIVLGLDGLDPKVVDLLLSEGKLPHFAKLRRGGAYGRLESQERCSIRSSGRRSPPGNPHRARDRALDVVT